MYISYHFFWLLQLFLFTNYHISNKIVYGDDIPSIPLYMDQVLMMMDQMLSDNKRNEDDKIMTKTMINNYSKEKIIRPIKGKTYPKEQLIQLLMVYNMKNCLTMQEMKQVMQTMYMDEQLDEAGFLRCYERLMHFKEKGKEVLPNALVSMLEDDLVGNKEDDLVTLLCLCTVSNQLQKIAYKLIDERFRASKDAK